MVTLAMLSALLTAQDRPIVGAAFFYWYEWDGMAQTGSWPSGLYNTPLYGYYSSARYGDNHRSMRLAADWGMTDLFIDYWGRGWLDNEGKPRELLLLRAIEELRSRGYGIHLSMYQDDEDFDMDDMAANVAPGRDLRRLDPVPRPAPWSDLREERHARSLRGRGGLSPFPPRPLRRPRCSQPRVGRHPRFVG